MTKARRPFGVRCCSSRSGCWTSRRQPTDQWCHAGHLANEDEARGASASRSALLLDAPSFLLGVPLFLLDVISFLLGDFSFLLRESPFLLGELPFLLAVFPAPLGVFPVLLATFSALGGKAASQVRAGAHIFPKSRLGATDLRGAAMGACRRRV